MHTLLLWDIDGTLIKSHGAGLRAMEKAFQAQFGKPTDLSQIDWTGRTDAWIITTVLRRHALPDSRKNIRAFIDAYLEQLPIELGRETRSEVLPGVAPLLKAMQSCGNVAQGLLTGNQSAGAQAKLNHHGLLAYFPFGAFADDSPQRNDLGPVALRRAHEYHKQPFTPDQTVVIGDTPHDIECGRVIGARTLAVATGTYSLEELLAHEPTHAMADLSDTEAFTRAVGI